MLMLSRRAGEAIVIQGGITVWVASIDGNRVRIGIDAPKLLRVDRLEVHERIQREGLKVSATAKGAR